MPFFFKKRFLSHTCTALKCAGEVGENEVVVGVVVRGIVDQPARGAIDQALICSSFSAISSQWRAYFGEEVNQEVGAGVSLRIGRSDGTPTRRALTPHSAGEGSPNPCTIMRAARL